MIMVLAVLNPFKRYCEHRSAHSAEVGIIPLLQTNPSMIFKYLA
jgi:hypothetical protein